jgi:hypothetical protein
MHLFAPYILFITIAAVNPTNGALNSLSITTQEFQTQNSCLLAYDKFIKQVQPDIHLAYTGWCQAK